MAKRTVHRTTARVLPVNAAGEVLLKLEGIRKVLETTEVETHALAGIDLTVRAGEWVSIVGPSGSGKSTLLHCAAGLEIPESGRVLLGGTDLGALSERRRTLLRRERIGFVFQAFNLVPSLSAR